MTQTFLRIRIGQLTGVDLGAAFDQRRDPAVANDTEPTAFGVVNHKNRIRCRPGGAREFAHDAHDAVGVAAGAGEIGYVKDQAARHSQAFDESMSDEHDLCPARHAASSAAQDTGALHERLVEIMSDSSAVSNRAAISSHESPCWRRNAASC